MKKRLILELKNFFSNDNESFEHLKNNHRVKAIQGLSHLISYLNQEETLPKLIAGKLEDVIVCLVIKKDTATVVEKELLVLLRDIQKNSDFKEGSLTSLASSNGNFFVGSNSIATRRLN